MGLLAAITLSVFLSLGTYARNGNDPGLYIGNVLSKPDTLVQVPVYADFSELSAGAGAFDLYVAFDPEVLLYLNFIKVHAEFPTLTVIPPLSSDTIIHIAWFSFGSSLQTVDTLVVLEFHYVGGESDLTFLSTGDHVSTVYDGINISEIQEMVFYHGSVRPVTHETYLLTYLAGENGTLNGDTLQQIVHGGDGTPVEAIPDPGYHFAGWDDGVFENPRTDTEVTNSILVTALFELNTHDLMIIIEGEGLVKVDGDNYVTALQFGHGHEASIEAMPAEGWQFDGWTGDLVSTDASQEVTMDGNKTITATFSEIPPEQYTLTVVIIGNGTVNADDQPYTAPITVVEGTTIALAAIPADGWQFDGWTGDLVSTDASQEVTMDSNKTVTATFSEIPPEQYTLTVMIIGNGTVNADDQPYTAPITVVEGTTITLQAIPADGWQFDGWTGDLTNTDPSQNITMDKDKVVTANFSEKYYTITFIVMNRSDILINDARITFNDTQHPEGMYLFEDLPAGSYNYTVSRDGFLDGTGTATITDSDIEMVVILDIDPVRTAFLKVYPNPTNYLLTIESNESFRELEVYNALGQIVLSSSFNDRMKHTIEVGHLASGMYLVRVFSLNDRRSATFEVIR